jgi:hypothetical protein
MEEYTVDILPGEVLRWVREDAARTAPSLWVRASKEYQVEPGFDRERARIGEEEVAPVAVNGIVEISPQGGGGWTLQIRAEDSVGLRPSGEEEGYEAEDDMTIDAFESQLLAPERGEVEVVVVAEDTAAWNRFQRWLARQQKRQ